MKSLLGYLMIGLVKLLGLVPLSVAQKVGTGIGTMLWKRRTRSREVARLNLSLCYPGMEASERENFVRETLKENGKIAAELGPMWGYDPEKTYSLIRNVYGEDILDAAIADKRGLILLAPHLGNWEIINNFMSKKCPITIMYRPAKSPSFNNWMVTRRENVGCKLVPTTGAGVKTLFDTLNNGEMIGFLPDQEPREKSGVWAPFMGIETLTPKLPHEMLQKTGAQAIFGFAKRLPNAEGFDIYFLAADDDLYSDDARTSAASMNRAIEECISYCPAQYQWTYKRFNRLPEGGRTRYRIANIP